MGDATVTAVTTVDRAEAEHFGRLAADWWNPKGSSAMLHRLNPPRLAYLRAAIDRHWASDPAGFTPLSGRTAIDVGCGAGLVTEPLARLGAAVTGIDAAHENIGAAHAHAANNGLEIEYLTGGIEAVAGRRFDLVVSFEVIEHVADPAGFVAGLAAALAPGGLMLLSTPNRTAWSRLAMVTIGERTGAIPPGTHDWGKFVTPAELAAMLDDAGLDVVDVQGLGVSAARGFMLTKSTALDYFIIARSR